MIKQDLIMTVANRTGKSPCDVKEVLETALASMCEELKDGKEVVLRGFGCFKVRTRAPKSVRNINTGTQYTMPAQRRVVFEPGKQLKII